MEMTKNNEIETTIWMETLSLVGLCLRRMRANCSRLRARLCALLRRSRLAGEKNGERADESHDGEDGERDEVALRAVVHESGEQRREYHRYVRRHHVQAEYRAEVLPAEEVADYRG